MNAVELPVLIKQWGTYIYIYICTYLCKYIIYTSVHTYIYMHIYVMYNFSSVTAPPAFRRLIQNSNDLNR